METALNSSLRLQLTDENGVKLLLEVCQMSAANSAILGEKHELGASLVTGRQHVL